MMFRKAGRIEKEGIFMSKSNHLSKAWKWHLIIVALLFGVFIQSDLYAFTLNVVDGNGNPIPVGFRWLLEEDTTNVTVPGAQVNNSISLSIHKSHAPVVTKDYSAANPATVNVPSNKRYFVSVLPYSDYSLGGAVVQEGAASVTVIVQKLPLPTAQISILAFVDQGPINNGFDEGEQGLGGCTVQLFDVAGGPINQDAFGNPLGTRYLMTCDAAGQSQGTGTNPCVDQATGEYVVAQPGNGFVFTLTKVDFNAALGFAADGVTPLPGGPDPTRNPYNLKVGEALVKYLAPGKYGVILVPPNIDDNGSRIDWIQTTTIEGTPTIDAWVKANEPTLFIEGFGTGFKHAAFGFIKDPTSTGPQISTFKGQTFEIPPWNKIPPEDLPPGPYGTIRGTLRANHFARPPFTQGFHAGEPVPECWVGLNDPNIAREVPLPGGGETFSKNGRYATPCNGNSEFVIPNVPPGTYQLVWWDRPLDYLFGFQSVTVPAGGGDVNLGDVLAYRWFGTLQGTVFYDANENGFRDPGEVGIQSQTGNLNQVLNIRFRDGTIYQTTVTDPNGEYEFAEVFPFFKWLIVEVGFANFKATGMTAVVDAGGAVPTHAQTAPEPPKLISTMPSFNKLSPQHQVTPPNWPANRPASTNPVNNPNTGNNRSRSDTGPILLQAMHLFLNQANVIDWGKKDYAPGDIDNPPLGNFPGPEDVDHNGNGIFDFGENGGITGIVFYATTRAENDPVVAVGDGWEPGIPRVQVNLYLDNVNNTTGLPGPDGIPDDINGDGQVTLADADNYPFAGRTPFRGRPGPEDLNRDAKGGFKSGDAINIVWTDSWDDNPPTGCIQPLPIVHGRPIKECADTFATWNQVRDGVFDGGYAFTSYFLNRAGNPVPFRTLGAIETPLPPGTYIVEVIVPPGYKLVKEEDKNVDLGDSYIPGLLITPPPCVNWDDVDGDGLPGRVVPQYLSLQTDENGIPLPGIPLGALIAAPFAGESRPLCDRKQVTLSEGQNAAADFHLFTEVPKAARAVGFANNDLSAEFNVLSPNFGEKLAPSWIPVSFRDWTGKEIVRVYTDEFGSYNALLPSTYTVNIPTPSGVSPNMMTLVLNHPTRADGTPDPYYNPAYSVTPWTLQYYPGSITYLDTPLVPLAAFSAAGVALDTNAPNGTPAISAVNGPEPNGGPLVCSAQPNGGNITITSVGSVEVQNPNYNPALRRGRRNPFLITRDYGFGNIQGTVTLGGVELPIVSWDPTTIVATVPLGAQSGRLMVTRSSGATAEIGVMLNVVDCAATPIIRVPADRPTIQAAIDAAAAGSLILVAPGTYNENVIMYKRVFLQGAGAGSTLIYADPNPLDRLQAWHNRIELPPPAGLGGAAYQAFLLKNVFFQNEAPGISVIGELTHDGGNLQFPDPANPQTLNPGNPFPTPAVGPAGINARINGFKIIGSKAGGGITAFAGARHLEISDNEFTNNQGNDAGAIGIGISDIGFAQQNTNVVIRNNKIHKNGGVQGPGGIGVNEDSNDYLIENNLITGNFSRFNGGAIAHSGLILGTGIIRGNKILFNECHFGALLNQAGDGGAIYIAGDIAGGTGSGNVTIDSNLIQGNMTGSGYGGGIRAFAVNGLEISANPSNTPPVDPLDDPPQWFELKIMNNIIVNNVAGLAGAGIALQDVVLPRIINNTIANNDSTATAALAFTAGQLNSNPQPAGVVAGRHTGVLLGFLQAAGVPPPYNTQTFSNPLLVNNIIWHNRSFYNQVTATPPGFILAPWDPDNDPNTLNDPYWDLSVLGSVLPTDPRMSPANCILSQQLDPKTGFDYGAPPANLYVDPLFVSEYFNQLQSAAVLDEGGNFINVLISPIVPTGDYHIKAPKGAQPGSPAINAGVDTYIAQFPELGKDFDGQTRPSGGVSDMGADELP